MNFWELSHFIKNDPPKHFISTERPSIEVNHKSDIYTGKGVGIAILDTGVSLVDDFLLPQKRIIAFRDFVNGKTTPYDDNGHGTHVTYLNSYKVALLN